MAITYINGPEQSGKSRIANALRNYQIAQGFGALLIDEQNDGEPKPLVEKLLVGIELPERVKDLASLPWKESPLVIVVNKAGRAKLGEIEAILPGFTEFMSADGASTLTTGIAGA